MSNRRLVAAAFFSVVILIVLGIIIFVDVSNSGQTVNVWVLQHNVAAGQSFSDSDVQIQTIHASSNDFKFTSHTPGNYPSTYRVSLDQGDILRDDDLVPVDQLAQVSVTITGAPPINAGDTIDIFASVTGTEIPIATSITVVNISGSSLTIAVPVSQELDWITISSSQTTLHAARSVGKPSFKSGASSSDAVARLCASAVGNAGGTALCTGLSVGSGASPSASASPKP